MKPDTKQILKGVGIAAGLQAAGAAIGIAANPACSVPPKTTDNWFCGPTGGAVLGDMTASGVSVMTGLGIAVFSQKNRAVGIGMAVGPTLINFTAGLALRIFGGPAPAVTSATTPAGSLPASAGVDPLSNPAARTTPPVVSL